MDTAAITVHVTPSKPDNFTTSQPRPGPEGPQWSQSCGSQSVNFIGRERVDFFPVAFGAFDRESVEDVFFEVSVFDPLRDAPPQRDEEVVDPLFTEMRAGDPIADIGAGEVGEVLVSDARDQRLRILPVFADGFRLKLFLQSVDVGGEGVRQSSPGRRRCAGAVREVVGVDERAGGDFMLNARLQSCGPFEIRRRGLEP